MTVEAGATYGDREIAGPRGWVTVTEVEGVKVKFHPAGGGPVAIWPLKRFSKRFDLVEDVEHSAATSALERIHVEIGDGRPIPAWSDGRLWNGFEQPLFEREAVEAAIAQGSLTNETLHTELLEYGVFYVESQGGVDLEARDWSGVVQELRDGVRESGSELNPGSDVYVHLNGFFEKETDGRRIAVCWIGDGWCWERVDGPAEAPLP